MARVVRTLLLARAAAFAAGSAVSTMLAACGSGSGGVDGGSTGPKPQISIALDPAAVSVVQGASTTITVRVAGSNGFTGPATISVSGGPSGVTMSNSVPQVASGVTTVVVSVGVSVAAATGTYTLTITAAGPGVTSVTASLGLTVTPAAPIGGFTLASNPGTLTVVQGSSVTSTIVVNRTGGFSGSVGLVASGMSSGLSAILNPPSASAGSATLAITASSIAATGTVTLSVVGTATGQSAQSTTVQVTVVPAQNGGTSGDATVDFSNCPSEAKPVWFAYQDGNGSWTRVASSTDVYRFAISSNAGGYAYVTRQSADHSAVAVSLLSRGELTSAPIVACPTPTGNKTVIANVSAIGASEEGIVSLGGSSVEALTAGAVQIPRVPNGLYDLVAWRFNNARGINTATDTRAVIIRDVNVPDHDTAGTVNFASPDASAIVAWSVAFVGAGTGDAFTGSMSYYTGPPASCTSALLYNFSTNAPSVPASAYGFAQSVQRATDFHVLRVAASNYPNTRVSQSSFHTAGSVPSLHLLDPISAPIVSDVSGAGYKRLQVAGSTPGVYSSSMVLFYSDELDAKSASIQASISWLGGNAATLTFPDFAGIAGWDGAWMPQSTSTVNWTFGGTSTSSGPVCAEGATFFAAYYSGTK